MWESILLKREEINAERWDQFVAASPQNYLYYYSWYLDAACPAWLAIVVTERGRWVAVMPIPFHKKGPFLYSFQPHLTQFGGIVFGKIEKVKHRHYHLLKTAINKALEVLPKGFFAIDINLHPGIQYFLPFAWQKFEVLPRFTYWLPADRGYEDLEKQFSSSVTNHLKKAKKSGLTIETSRDETCLADVAIREKIFNPAQATVFSKVWKAVNQRNKGFLLYAKNAEGSICAGAAFILDGDKMIFYAIAQNKAHKKSGANALLISEAIRRCCETEGMSYFDFEGSMIEPVEQYFRSFNPEAKIYFKIRKYRLPLIYKLYRALTGG